MNTSPPSSQSKHRGNHRSHAGPTFKIVTFYEDFADAARALKEFDSIVRSFSGGLPVRATSWSFRLLGNPKLNSIILDDVSPADVVVVATNGDRELPEGIASWLESCVHAIPGNRPVILALHDDGLEMDGVAAPLCSSLNGVADRTDATFMCNRDLVSKRSEVPAEPIHTRRESRDSDFELALYPATETARWWGIND